MDKNDKNFSRQKATAEKMEADRKALLDAVKMIYEKKVFSGYRLYAKIRLNAGFVTVGVEVKNMGMDLEVNSIQTVFIRRRKGDLEEEIYRDPEITQEQSAILDKRGHKKQHPSNRHF